MSIIKRLTAVFSFVAFVSIPLLSDAAIMRGGDQYTLSKDEEVQENLYVAGGNVVVAGTANADLFAAGGTVLVSGLVFGDLGVVGGTVNVLGDTYGDVRVVGGNTMLNGLVGGEVIIAGGEIVIGSDAVISEDLVIAGGKVNIEGEVLGNVRIYGGEVVLNGSVRGSVNTWTDTLKVGSLANVSGGFEYQSPKEASISSEALIGGPVKYVPMQFDMSDKDKGSRRGHSGFLSMWWFLKTLILLATALVFYFLFKDKMAKVVPTSFDNFGLSMFWGFVALALMPIAAIFLFMTGAGFLLGGILLLAYALLLSIACIFGRIIFGSLLYKLIKKSSEYEVSWKTVTMGVIVFQILKEIPILGFIFSLAFFLMTLGVLVKGYKEKYLAGA